MITPDTFPDDEQKKREKKNRKGNLQQRTKSAYSSNSQFCTYLKSLALLRLAEVTIDDENSGAYSDRHWCVIGR